MSSKIVAKIEQINAHPVHLSTFMRYKLKISLRVETDAKKIILAQSFTITKKSTISFQSLRNLLKMISSWEGKVAWLSAWLDKNWGLFTKSQFLSLSNYFCISLYFHLSEVMSCYNGREGVKKLEILSDVIYGWSQLKFHLDIIMILILKMTLEDFFPSYWKVDDLLQFFTLMLKLVWLVKSVETLNDIMIWLGSLHYTVSLTANS